MNQIARVATLSGCGVLVLACLSCLVPQQRKTEEITRLQQQKLELLLQIEKNWRKGNENYNEDAKQS